MTLAGTVLLAALAASPAATPGAAETAMPQRRFVQAFRGDIGLFSAIGSIGLAYSVEPERFLLIELGGGLGGSGLQLSLMPKLVLGAAHRFTPGVGVSVGFPAGNMGLTSRAGGSEHVTMPWLNADLLAYDYRSRSGWSLFAAAGITMALGHGCVVIESSCTDLHGTPFPQVRLGVGHWF